MNRTSVAAFLSAMALVLGLEMPASAQPVSSIHERMNRLERRIDRGVSEGSLNRREERDLREQLDRIKDREARMRRDGRLDPRERDRLQEDLDRLERRIRRDRND